MCLIVQKNINCIDYPIHIATGKLHPKILIIFYFLSFKYVLLCIKKYNIYRVHILCNYYNFGKHENVMQYICILRT